MISCVYCSEYIHVQTQNQNQELISIFSEVVKCADCKYRESMCEYAHKDTYVCTHTHVVTIWDEISSLLTTRIAYQLGQF